MSPDPAGRDRSVATVSEEPFHGTPVALREYIHEMAEGARIQAGLVMQYAELGDDVGLVYALRRQRAYVSAQIATAKELMSAMRPKGSGASCAGTSEGSGV